MCCDVCTQNGQHRVVLQNLHGARADEVDGLERVPLADEELPRSAEGVLDDQRQGAQTPPAGGLEQRQLQQLFVQVHGDVGPQLVRKVLQQLEDKRQNRVFLSAVSICGKQKVFDPPALRKFTVFTRLQEKQSSPPCL